MSARVLVSVKDSSSEAAAVVAGTLLGRQTQFAAKKQGFLSDSSSSMSPSGSDNSSYASSSYSSSSSSVPARTRRTRGVAVREMTAALPAVAPTRDFKSRAQFKSAMKRTEQQQCKQLDKAARKLARVTKRLLAETATVSHLGRVDKAALGVAGLAGVTGVTGGVAGLNVVAPQVNGVAFASAPAASVQYAAAAPAMQYVQTSMAPVAQTQVQTQVQEIVQPEATYQLHQVQPVVHEVVATPVVAAPAMTAVTAQVQQMHQVQMPVQVQQIQAPVQVQQVQMPVQVQQVQVEEPQRAFQVVVEDIPQPVVQPVATAQATVTTAVAAPTVQPLHIQAAPLQFAVAQQTQVAMPEVTTQLVQAPEVTTMSTMPVFLVGAQPELVQTAQVAQVAQQMPFQYVVNLQEGAMGLRTVQLASAERLGTDELTVWCNKHLKTICKSLKIIESAMYDSYKAGVNHAGFQMDASASSSTSGFTTSSSQTTSSSSSSASTQVTAAARQKRRA